MGKIERISISAADRERLERLVRDRNIPQKMVWRAQMVLLASVCAGLMTFALVAALFAINVLPRWITCVSTAYAPLPLTVAPRWRAIRDRTIRERSSPDCEDAIRATYQP